MIEIIGWASSLILLATLVKQVYKQWSEGTGEGISQWLFLGQLAASIGMLPPGVRERAAVDVLERYGSDPVVMDAALSGLRGNEWAVLERLLGRRN